MSPDDPVSNGLPTDHADQNSPADQAETTDPMIAPVLAPTDQTLASPPADQPAEENAEPAAELQQPKATAPKVEKPPKNGVNLAIFSTVIIVIALASLAVYAYLKTK